MMTARDVIAKAAWDFGEEMRNKPWPLDWCFLLADAIIAAEISAPDSVRMELAHQLLPGWNFVKPLPAPPSEDKPCSMRSNNSYRTT